MKVSYLQMKRGGYYRYDPEDFDDGIPLFTEIPIAASLSSKFRPTFRTSSREFLAPGQHLFVIETTVAGPSFRASVLVSPAQDPDHRYLQGHFFIVINIEMDPFSKEKQFVVICE